MRIHALPESLVPIQRHLLGRHQLGQVALEGAVVEVVEDLAIEHHEPAVDVIGHARLFAKLGYQMLFRIGRYQSVFGI